MRAYRRAAASIAALERPVDELAREGGLEALEAIPAVGVSIARAVMELVTHGRLPMLDRLRGSADPEVVLGAVPGIGPRLAWKLHHELGIDSLESLELAAYDGRLERIAGFGPKRLAGIREVLAQRLQRVRTRASTPNHEPPTVGELLDVDREYRERVDRADLPTIAPRRFNPHHTAWLPVLHTDRGGHHYTALYSNTARAHQLGRTHDWVVVYYDGGLGEGQCTVITAERGVQRGRRIVRGREEECAELYRRLEHESTVHH